MKTLLKACTRNRAGILYFLFFWCIAWNTCKKYCFIIFLVYLFLLKSYSYDYDTPVGFFGNYNDIRNWLWLLNETCGWTRLNTQAIKRMCFQAKSWVLLKNKENGKQGNAKIQIKIISNYVMTTNTPCCSHQCLCFCFLFQIIMLIWEIYPAYSKTL